MVPCFNDTLVQANLANVRELKRAILNLDTEKIANFSLALTTAFELLETYRTEREGARCNQAIMLITDGVPYNYKEIFETYNWRDNPDEPFKADMPVRMFTCFITFYYVFIFNLIDNIDRVENKRLKFLSLRFLNMFL